MTERKLTQKEYDNVAEEVRQRFYEFAGWTWGPESIDALEFGCINSNKTGLPFLKSKKREKLGE